LLLGNGCRDNPANPPETLGALPGIVNAVYVLNEGNYNDPTGARLSVYDIDRDTVYKDVLELANNGQHLGSTGDDLKLYQGKAFILMSHSENIDVISLETHQLLRSATFPGSIPREMLFDSVRNRLYVSRTNSGAVYVLDPSTLGVMNSITVGNNPLGMALKGNHLFVCNSGYGLDRTVSVIDVDADTVAATLELWDGPTSAAVSPDGSVWVVCTGNQYGAPPTNGKIFVIDPAVLAVTDSISFPQSLWGTIAMGTNGYAYVTTVAGFYGGPLDRISLVAKTVQSGFIPDTSYAMAVDGVTGDIYVANAANFSADGVVSVYSNDGVLQKRFAAQRGPGAIAFKHQ
jgi:YVTN family beta-propeller protein